MKLHPFTIMLAIALLCAQQAAALQWSEILFNPAGTDYGKEYVELVGSENLTGCTIRDRNSADTLALERHGGDTILILEDNSTWLDAAAAANATIYTIGKAIGNGLDNTYEELNISCDNVVIASTSYNVSRIPGFSEGHAIVWNSSAGGWSLGEINGTPGVRQTHHAPDTTDNTSQDTPSNPLQGSLSVEQADTSSGGGGRFCNNTLIITVNNATRRPGEQLSFTITSDVYASFEVTAELGNQSAQTLMRGDTLARREYSTTVPLAVRIRIAAFAENCGIRLRASRIITIDTANQDGAGQGSTDQGSADPDDTSGAGNSTGNSTQGASAGNTSNQSIDSSTNADSIPVKVSTAHSDVLAATREDTQALAPERKAPPPSAPPATAAVVMDTDRSIVPWVSAFGIVTLAVSALVLLQLRKEQNEKQNEGQDERPNSPAPAKPATPLKRVIEERRGAARTKYIRRRSARQGHEAEPDTRASRQGMDPGDRHI
jgi:hypothetical protein